LKLTVTIGEAERRGIADTSAEAFAALP